ncbi:MAG: hypothetical protein MI922_23490, partial [Bacteroidales bacterium]|nr:hypothetical protein [Bacteroidales bacterium]
MLLIIIGGSEMLHGKKSLLVLLAIFCVALTSQAVEIVNPDFSLPGTGKIQGGIDVWDDIPGWTAAGGGKSGVEQNDGIWMTSAGGPHAQIYQITETLVEAGTYYLVFDSRNNWNASHVVGEIVYDNDGELVVLADGTFDYSVNLEYLSNLTVVVDVPADSNGFNA